MAASSHKETAKIYTFPVRARTTGPEAYHGSAKPVADLSAARLPRVDFGSGWYHDAAIQDTSEPRKH